MQQFLKDVLQGLTETPKRLSSKYFYDKKGDALFQSIMSSQEYYPTRCEEEIFSNRTKDIAITLKNGFNTFDLVELGAGDATKSSILLKEFAETGVDFTYIPIDISAAMIDHLDLSLPHLIKGLRINGLRGEYLQMLEKAYSISDRKKAVMLLGGNIGNESPESAIIFCRKIRSFMSEGDLILVGFDLKKNPYTILAAYNDQQGYTKAFNLNLLHRINDELGGNFDVSKYDHFPTYDPVTGACKSYLVSKADQEVVIAGELFKFMIDEIIFMEISQKYTIKEIENLGEESGFKPIRHFFDKKGWFVDTVWQAI